MGSEPLSAMIISAKYIIFSLFQSYDIYHYFLGPLVTCFNKSRCYGLWFCGNLFDSSYFRKNKGSKVQFITLQEIALKEISIQYLEINSLILEIDRGTKLDMRKIQEIVVKLSYFGFTRTCGEVVVSECHVIPSPVNLIGCPVKCVRTANLVVKLSVTQNGQ